MTPTGIGRGLRVMVQDPARGLRALARRAPRFIGHRDYVPFIVLSRSRTGSNLLVSFLNSHPHAYAEGEIMGRLGTRDPRRAVDEAFGRQARYIRAKGFKLFYYHPVDQDPRTLSSILVGIEALRVVHLRRRNILRTVTSRRIAEIRDHWTSVETARGSTPVSASVTFEPEELRREFEQTCRWELEGQRTFADLPVHELAYEDLVDDPVRRFREVTNFLHLEPCVPRTPFRRQNPQPLSQLIDNYDELKLSFRGSPWQDFFVD